MTTMRTTILFWAIAVSTPSVLVAYVEPAPYSFVPLTEEPAQTAVFALQRAAAATETAVSSAALGGSSAPLQAIAESRGVGRCAVNRACE
jgi:hypothetical protein